MDSLVLQIAMWRDADSVRARITSDADGRPGTQVADSIEEVLELVEHDLQRWIERGNDADATAR